MGLFSGLVDVKGSKHIVEGDTNLFPEHFDDPQKTFSLGGARVVEMLIGL